MNTFQLILYCYLINLVSTYRILIHCDAATRSHIKGVLEISEHLSTLGHEIVYASQKANMKFSKGYNVTQVGLEGDIKFFTDISLVKNFGNELNTRKIHQHFLSQIPTIMSRFHQINYKQLFQLSTETNFDLFICDFMATACQDVAKAKGIPLVVGFQTIDFIPELMEGYKTTTDGYGPLTIQNSNFFERYQYKFINPVKGMPTFLKITQELSKSRKKHNIKSSVIFGDLEYGLGIANTFFGFEVPSKLPSNLHLIGPLSKVPKDISMNDNGGSGISELLDNHDKILYVAFGSYAELDAKTVYKLLYSILYSIETKVVDGVVWGLGRTEFKGLPEEIKVGNKIYNREKLLNNEYFNIKLLKWAPQYSILNHKNTRLFISHGGLESITEATMTATPILCVPILGDQPRNSKKIEEMGIGAHVDSDNIQSKMVIDKIKLILEDKDGKYKSNSKKYQLITRDPEKRIEYAASIVINHIELAKLCRPFSPFNPNKDTIPCELSHLIHPAMKLNPIIKYNLDIYLANILIIGLILFFMAKISYFIVAKLISTIRSKTHYIDNKKIK
ncbi:UDP-Glycosyltransferase/glycogen phosphorylase [Neoconidiobolus thromboides FSU 785]|nr:UDP-Glycosyltransferase/glycogen phosphorylase [Neoconidiobolus thromboides FSU 785]